MKFVSKATISNRETGYSKPRLEMAITVSEILDEDVAFLFGYIYKNLVQKITYLAIGVHNERGKYHLSAEFMRKIKKAT
ncbi:helix-turn-helix transcriptional regulator [Lysinibacillus sp. GbtcB16]|uniref:helix-turn-helix domain-containing protein n=1 Tax=Lysinibacillus sp. GbtcB16 TaxID=2824761 RepID=UPI0020C72DC4|nr:helix-turn-helix transcriptional regulator [Lysinibacillus sp. GbtcB16]